MTKSQGPKLPSFTQSIVSLPEFKSIYKYVCMYVCRSWYWPKGNEALLLYADNFLRCLPLASGEELSKKQAAQESQIRKLRAQVYN